jgi:hypothetical protein
MCAGTCAIRSVPQFQPSALPDEYMSAKSLGPRSVFDLDSACWRKPSRLHSCTGYLSSIATKRRARIGGMGTGFCDDSVLHGPTTPYTMERVTLIFLWAKSMSPHFKPNISLCRKPVEAARRTNVRSRTSKLSTNALISLGTSTVGGLRRFAL